MTNIKSASNIFLIKTFKSAPFMGAFLCKILNFLNFLNLPIDKKFKVWYNLANRKGKIRENRTFQVHASLRLFKHFPLILLF